MNKFEGVLLGKGLRFGLVASRFNEFFSSKLLILGKFSHFCF